MLLISLECWVAWWNTGSVYWYLRDLYLDISSVCIDPATGPKHAESSRHSLALGTACSHLKSWINLKCMKIGVINLINLLGHFNMIKFVIAEEILRLIPIHIPLRLNLHKKIDFILKLYINLGNNKAPQ